MTRIDFSVLAFIALVLTAIAFPGETQAQDIGEFQEPFCIDCSLCSLGGGELGHKTLGGDASSVYNWEASDWWHNGTHGCYPHFCDSHGADCDITLAERLRLVQLAVGEDVGDVEAVRRVVEQDTSGRLEFSEERLAVHIISCDGSVLAHLPLLGSGIQLAGSRP